MTKKIQPLTNNLVSVLSGIISNPKSRANLPVSVIKFLQANRIAIHKANAVYEEKRVVEIMLHDGKEVRNQMGGVSHYELPEYPTRSKATGKDAEFEKKVMEVKDARDNCNAALGILAEQLSGVFLKGAIPQQDFNQFLLAVGTVEIGDIEGCIEIIQEKEGEKK